MLRQDVHQSQKPSSPLVVPVSMPLHWQNKSHPLDMPILLHGAYLWRCQISTHQLFSMLTVRLLPADRERWFRLKPSQSHFPLPFFQAVLPYRLDLHDPFHWWKLPMHPLVFLRLWFPVVREWFFLWKCPLLSLTHPCRWYFPRNTLKNKKNLRLIPAHFVWNWSDHIFS